VFVAVGGGGVDVSVEDMGVDISIRVFVADIAVGVAGGLHDTKPIEMTSTKSRKINLERFIVCSFCS